MNYYAYLKSPIGLLEIVANDKAIIQITSASKRSPTTQKDPPAHLKQCLLQLEQYFSGERVEFDLPLEASGSEFQKKVWKQLEKIPYGKTCSYGDIAKKINKLGAQRAVGGANNKNPIMIVIPCHRVIGSSGQLVGYGGGLEKKRWLLSHEAQQ